MLPLCADESVGMVVWSPLARGRLARPWGKPKAANRGKTTVSLTRSIPLKPRSPPGRSWMPSAQSPRLTESSERRSWLHGCGTTVVVAPLVGANTTQQIDDAVFASSMPGSRGSESRVLHPPIRPAATTRASRRMRNYSGSGIDCRTPRPRTRTQGKPPTDA